ncbi:AAA family ATPase [Faucicola mancuniensis]|uniref:AAA family ATPase n=1 Tax=Faucicola mancuniensis TaxID=1309795 RepID=UPI003977D662
MQSSSPLQQNFQQMLNSINQIVLDKPEVVKLSVACLLANGHLLLQDLPGMGKTTLAHAIANHLGLDFNRVQFTSDMLPADILGISLYKTDTGTFEFKPGPVFCQLLLADEINRSSPKTQSALLEAMEERQVSQDGVTRSLPELFFVIATQNPTQQSGVFVLPESQLDRFLMCLSLGYPSKQAEKELLLGIDRREMLKTVQPMLSMQDLLTAQTQVKQVHFADVVVDYLQRLVAKTRESRDYHGLSTRGVLALKHASQAYAYLGGYNEVTPEDIQAVFSAVVDHRLGQGFVPFNHLGGDTLNTIANDLLKQVPVVV